MGTHALAEARSIALHAAVAERLRADPTLIDRARERLETWATRGLMHPRYAEAWRAMLALPLEDLCTVLVDPSQTARDLRQSSPFAGALDPATRWRIWRGVQP